MIAPRQTGFNTLLGMILDSTSLVDPSVPVPNVTFIAPVVEALYAELFAGLLSFNTHVFPTSSETVIVLTNITVTRLFISPLMFRVSIIILGVQILVAILFYTNRPKRFLPRMPTSIGSIIAYIAASRAAEDFNGGPLDRCEKEHSEERRYGYGRFIGTDGRDKGGNREAEVRDTT